MTTFLLINPWEKTVRQVEGDLTDLDTIYRWLSQKDEYTVDCYGEYHLENGDVLYYDEDGSGQQARFKMKYPDGGYEIWYGRAIITRHPQHSDDELIPPLYTREELLKLITWG